VDDFTGASYATLGQRNAENAHAICDNLGVRRANCDERVVSPALRFGQVAIEAAAGAPWNADCLLQGRDSHGSHSDGHHGAAVHTYDEVGATDREQRVGCADVTSENTADPGRVVKTYKVSFANLLTFTGKKA
jgi:hypothetical protein